MVSLSEADKEAIRDVWGKVYANAEENGTTVLVRMFTEHPETKQYFSHFKDISTAEDMKGSPQVKAHGKRVMSALGDVVQHLDNLSSVLKPLAEKHANKHKVDPHNFKLLSDVILAVLAEKFGGDFTPEARAAWEKLLSVICTHLESAYK
nr:ancestral myo/hemoglobin [synthetic construct]